MKALKIELTCGKKRWIYSAVFTSFFISAILVFPFWNFHSGISSAPEAGSANTVSIVSVKKRKKAAPFQKIEKKISVPKEHIIPRKQILEQPVEEKVEKTEQTVEETAAETVPAEELDADMVTAESSVENVSAEPALSDSEKKARATYKSYALGRIASKKIYPYAARSKGLEGKVRVRIVINPDGNVTETELLEKCGHEVLNEACLSAIQKAAPFKKMPPGHKSLTLTFVMDFSLKERHR
ncbi:MAG: energy transducer TonB [Treponema sp.]|nr:energy transducer TonB [Treponema sp.]